MAIPLPGFLGPAYRSASRTADDELLENWFLEKNESPNAPNPWCMLPTPGFELFASVSQAPGRAPFYQRGRAFFVAGFAFYELFTDGSTTQRGTVAADTNPATICANGDAGDQLFITSGGVAYNYDLTSNTLSVTGVGGTTAIMGGFLSARFIYLDPNTGAFYASALYDGTTWDPSFVAQSQSGNPWRAMVVTPDGLIRLLGEFSGEAWADQGSAPFPFSKISNADIEFGIVSSFAFSVDTTITWVAQNAQGRGIVVRAPGYGPERISTHAIETTIQGYATLDGTISLGYQENGHSFSAFTFPDEATWVFDQTSALWHRRTFWDVSSGAVQAKPWRPSWVMQAFNKTLVGDRFTGDIFEMKSSFYSDVDGSVIRRVRQPPRYAVEQRLVTIDNMQVVMDVGNGLSNGQYTEPKLMLQVSRDGGKTFPIERWSSTGPIGAWDTRVRWNNLGQSRNHVFRYVATDPVPWKISECYINQRVGNF